MKRTTIFVILTSFMFVACFGQTPEKREKISREDSILNVKISEYATVRLTTDLNLLTEKERQMIPFLINAARNIDAIYWEQSIGNPELFFSKLKSQPERKFAEINYGPWERLNGNAPFLTNYGKKPIGLFFYPKGMHKEEFTKWDNPEKNNPYSLVRTNDDGTLRLVMYSEAYRDRLNIASDNLLKASELADDPGLKTYLEMRAKALVCDEYIKSDMAWMDMKNNTLDIVIGPIENYDDDLFGIRTSFEVVVLVKDQGWSKRLAKFAAFLPELQTGLPVAEKYKSEMPGTDSDLNAYDVIYVAGQANAGSKTIAINLPNDESVQMAKGSRRLQLKNVMKAKFDNILVPISNVMIEKSQKNLVSFDAFFSNVMFHEVAHGLGIKNTVTGGIPVREALKETYSSFEEAKADILGLYMVTKLIEKGEITNVTREQSYITYMAGLIRSVRFGAASAHGKANMMCFNFFAANNAFERTADGTYKVNIEKFTASMNMWAEKVLMIEGDGNYQNAYEYLSANGTLAGTLAGDLQRLKKSHIPVDIVYDQGLTVLGLNPTSKPAVKPDQKRPSGNQP